MKENSLEITTYIQIARKNYEEGNIYQANEIYRKLINKKIYTYDLLISYGQFNKEINNLKNLKVIVALGKIAFDACVSFYKTNYNFSDKIKFQHNKIYPLSNKIILVGCYHPSPRNVNTGRIDEKKMTNLFKKV